MNSGWLGLMATSTSRTVPLRSLHLKYQLIVIWEGCLCLCPYQTKGPISQGLSTFSSTPAMLFFSWLYMIHFTECGMTWKQQWKDAKQEPGGLCWSSPCWQIPTMGLSTLPPGIGRKRPSWRTSWQSRTCQLQLLENICTSCARRGECLSQAVVKMFRPSLTHCPLWTLLRPKDHSLIKLMRWFSWFESMAFYSGELWATKIILEDGLEVAEEGSGKDIDEGPLKEQKDPQKELADLKKRKGSWKLAPQMVIEKNVVVKDIIMSVAKASWELFAARARDIVSPLHVLEYNISCSHAGFWKNELVEMVHTALYDERFLQHLLPEYCIHEKAVEWHCDFLDKLLQTRSESLAAFHCLPPFLYHHILAPSTEVALQAHLSANKHWEILLAAEEAANEGVEVKRLKHLHWRKHPLIRCLLMGFEQDKIKHQFFTDRSCARRLQLVISKNLGDSRVIENVHQHGRDLFRSSKANSISNTAIMSNALRSNVLEKRKTPMVNAQEAAKALGPQWKPSYKESVVQSLKTKGKKLPTELQRMMQPQKGLNTWPSPAPGSLFLSAASTEWLFTFWGSNDPALKGVDINAAWLSFLARPGAVVAQRSTGLLMKVMCSAEFGFLALTMEAKEVGSGRIYLCQTSRADIIWRHIWDLDDWLEVQMSPFLVGRHTGPVGYRLSGDPPMPLEVAACIFGHPMTFKQASDLVSLFGGSLPPKASKKNAMEALIELVVPSENQDLAKSFLKIDEYDDKGFDSDFSEVISELAQDEGNQTDLKDFRDKKRIYNKKRQMAARDAPLQGKERKPKAKAKAKAKAKNKPKTSLGQKLLHRAAKQLAEKDADDMEEMPPPPVPPPPVPPPAPPPVPPPAEGPEELMVAEADSTTPEPAQPSRPSASGGPSGEPSGPTRERHRSPEEVMSILEPPGCKFGISFHDHRFTSVWREDHPELEAPYSQKRFSRSFGNQRTWQEAIIEVHERNWKKWNLLQAEYPLGEKVEMKAAQIPSSLMNQLQPVIDNLPPLVKYSKRWCMEKFHQQETLLPKAWSAGWQIEKVLILGEGLCRTANW